MFNKVVIIKGKYNLYDKKVNKNTVFYFCCNQGKIRINFTKQVKNILSINIYDNNVKYTLTNKNKDTFEMQFFKLTKLIIQNAQVEIINEKRTCINNLFKCRFYFFKSYELFFSYFFSVLLRFLMKNYMYVIFINLPVYAIFYIKNQPMGLKQNTIIKKNLALVFESINQCQVMLFKYFYIISLVTNLDKVLMKIGINFIFKIYKFNLNTLIELLSLFSDKSYNVVKKRYDKITLNVDQIIIGVILFSILILTFINIMPYYIFYVLYYLIYLLLEISEQFIIIILCRFNNFYFLDVEDKNYIKSVTYCTKINLLKKKIKIYNILRGELMNKK